MIDPLPIETAPKDGTRILLWGGAALDEEFPDRYDPGWHIGYWEGEFWSDDTGRVDLRGNALDAAASLAHSRDAKPLMGLHGSAGWGRSVFLS
jgi:hypothetical protein